MKIYGIFRGFPGLGRVMSGVALLNSLRRQGYEVYAYSYLQGLEVLKQNNISLIHDEQPSKLHIMVIGLNPISKIAGEIYDDIIKNKPDLVLVDGEPLFISTLSMIYPREKIISLLNPSDLHNPSLPISSRLFYQRHYLSAGYSIVHGVGVEKSEVLEKNSSEIKWVNTILRDEIINIKNNDSSKDIVGILGGGCQNSSKGFWESTILMGKKMIESSRILSAYRCRIYCNDRTVASALHQYLSENDSVEIFDSYVNAARMYSGAKAVICRAGRNTTSELLYLKIPSILLSANNDFRSEEQKKNINKVLQYNPDGIKTVDLSSSAQNLADNIKSVIKFSNPKVMFVPGNESALSFINDILHK